MFSGRGDDFKLSDAQLMMKSFNLLMALKDCSMKVHRVDYRLVPGLTHAMAGALLSRKCSTQTLSSPSFIGLAIDPDDRTCPRFIAQRTSLDIDFPFQSEKQVYLSKRVEAGPRVQCRVLNLNFILRNGYCRLAAVAATAGKYVKSGRIYFRMPGNYVIVGKLFCHSLI